MTAFERHLAELVAGSDGGWSLWLAALAGLEEEIRESRLIGRERFDQYPRGELRRLLLAIEDLLRRADFAVEVRETIARQVDDREQTDRIAEVLLRRAREVVAEQELPAENFHLRTDYPR